MDNPGGAGYLPRQYGETAGLPTGDGALTLMLTGYAEKHNIMQSAAPKL